MGFEDDNRYQGGYRPRPEPQKVNRRPTTTYSEGAPNVSGLNIGNHNISKDKQRIKELEEEVARLKGEADLPYGKRLLKFVKTFPRMKYEPYDSERLNEIYLSGQESGREEIIRYIE